MDGQSAVEYDSTGSSSSNNLNGQNDGTTQWGVSQSQATTIPSAGGTFYQANTKVGLPWCLLGRKYHQQKEL